MITSSHESGEVLLCPFHHHVNVVFVLKVFQVIYEVCFLSFELLQKIVKDYLGGVYR